MTIINNVINNYPWFFPILYFIFGGCIGSFLNVIIYRLPKNLSLTYPPSRCGSCETPIPFYLNIPFFGWLYLKGKCKTCKASISSRYIIMELITATLFTLSYFTFQPNLLISLYVCLFISLMLICTYIDLDTLTIPDGISVNVTGIYLAILAGLFFLLPAQDMKEPLISGLLGLMIGSGTVLWIALISESILKRETMGFGDVKLMGLIGLFLGWKIACLSIFLGSIITLFMILVFKIFKIKAGFSDEEHTEQGQFPFGPGLCIASIILTYLLYPMTYTL